MAYLVRKTDDVVMKKSSTYSDVLKVVSKNIKKYREINNYTQEDMAEFGFNYRFYQKLESGKYSPNLQTLYKVCMILQIDMETLFKS